MTTPVLAVLGEPIVPDHRPNCAILSTIKRQLSYPYPHPPDIPVLISGSLLMMVGFTVCIAFALRIMPAGRSVVLAYTSPLWVYPAARIILGEEFDFIRTAGTLLGVGGIALLVGPWVLIGRDATSSSARVCCLRHLCFGAPTLSICGHTRSARTHSQLLHGRWY